MEHISENEALFQQIMALMEAHFGKKCEIVLHDFTAEHDHTIVDIRNGEITGRAVGGCATNLGLEIMNGTVSAEDKFNYITYAPDGHILRSSSIYFHNSHGDPIGSLCLNLDITDTIYFENVCGNITIFGKTAAAIPPKKYLRPT